jgi:hypothetical protein
MPRTDEAATRPLPFWKRPYRMVQTNLRQPDALADPKRLARQVRDFGADVLLYNVGGIFAFYPTELKLHARNPYMKGDALGDILAACRIRTGSCTTAPASRWSTTAPTRPA